MRTERLSPEHEKFVAHVHEYASVYRDQVAEWDKQDGFDVGPVMRRAYEYGLTGITIPKEYGGQDLGAFEWTLAVEEIARTAMSWLPADPLFMTAGPGPAIILASENDVLKKEVLPRLVRGEAMAAINITEPGAGSAMTDLATVAVEDGDELVISGTKRHITGAGLAEYLVTFCRFGDVPGARGVGAVLIEGDRPGIEYGRNPDWLGLRGIPHPELTMTDVRIPRSNLLFAPGEFARLMRAFNLERLHNAVLSLGFAQAALELSQEFVREREQFGRPLVEFQGVQWQVADMYVDVEAARALIYEAALNADGGKYPEALDISLAKLFANEMGIRVVHQAADLHGALGYTTDFPIERVLRDNLVMPVAGGSVNIQRNTIAAELFKDVGLTQRRPRAATA